MATVKERKDRPLRNTMYANRRRKKNLAANGMSMQKFQAWADEARLN